MFNSYKRKHIDESKERALYDYLLADLIGKSVARIYNETNTFPDVAEQYPHLFDSVATQEQRQAREDELSAIRFKQFADSFNKKFNKGAANIE